jgi:casein kinase II subunit alpha
MVEEQKFPEDILPRKYAYATAEHGAEYSEYNHPHLNWSNIDSYQVGKKLGRGKYSEVFEGYKNEDKIVIKLLKPVKKRKFYREIKIL